MLFSFLQTWPKKLLSFKGMLNLYFPITVFTSRNWNQKKQSALAFLTKVFTMLIVTMQNTGKAPRFLILHIKKKTPNLKNSQSFSNLLFVTKCKFALQLIMTYSNGIKTASKGMC